MSSQLVGRLKLDVVAIAPELDHQIGAPLDHAGPPGDVVEDLIYNVASNGVEEVLTINEVA
jgi:hypothetical protein